ncbi:MAG: metallophosphoesterase [Bacteroidales bacterium]|jgi:predicted phosphodiesterase|nr:metallophosphoesterase [Bacteroidales bacterium]MCI2146080.1 metallophosphoesterase [Bacteroidales bacterium]
MRIQFASDIHLEFSENMSFIRSHPFEAAGDVLILAGDSFYLNDPVIPKDNLWKQLSKTYRQVMLIPGNHEFYNHGDIAERGDSWSRMLLPNVGYHYNKVVRIDDTDFILSTLWSHVRPENELRVYFGMNDFRQILYGGRRLTVADFNAEHEKCLAFVKQSVAQSSAKHIVVATHHVPTLEAVAKCHRGDPLVDAFANELKDFIAGSRIDYWIYGHSHENVDARIGSTKIVANQLGYVFEGEERKGFSPGRFVEV